MATQNDINMRIVVDANQAEQSTTNYKKTLKDLQAQMIELQVSTNGLANATDEQRAQYAALEQQAGKLSDAISDVSTRVRANADDYQTFNAALEGLKGGAAVAQGLVGTLDLLGISNTGVEQVVKTLMSLQGVMNSINTVQALFNKDSKIRIALTKLMTTATVTQTGATETATAAQKAMNVAMNAMPIMAIVSAAALLITALTKIAKKNKEVTKTTDEAAQAQRDYNQAINDIKLKYDDINSQLITLIGRMQSFGEGTEGEAAALKTFNQLLGTNVKTYYEASAARKEWANTVGPAMKSVDEWTEKLKNGTVAHSTALYELTRAQINLNLVQDQFSKKYGKEAKNTTKEITSAVEEQTSAVEEQTTKLLDLAEMRRRINEEARKDEAETYEGKRRQLIEEIDLTEKAFEQEKEDMKVVLGEETQEYADWLDLRETQISQHLENVNKEIERLDIKEQRRRIDRQNKVDSEILDARLANVKEGSAEYYNVQRQIENEQHQQYLEDLKRRLEDAQITKEEYRQLEYEAELHHQQNLTNIQVEEDSNRIAATQKRLELVGQMLQYASDFTQALMDAELAAAEGNEREQKEIKKKYAVANAMMQIGQIGVQTALGAISAFQAMSGIPVVGPALGAVAAALVTATGVAQAVKAIAEKNKIMKAAKGAFVVGNSHQQGGVMMELEGGEAVLNKRAMAIPQYRNLASAMNVATGGVAFPGTTPTTSIINRNDLKMIVSETVAAVTAIPVVVSEQSITNVQRKVGVIEGRSRF